MIDFYMYFEEGDIQKAYTVFFDAIDEDPDDYIIKEFWSLHDAGFQAAIKFIVTEEYGKALKELSDESNKVFDLYLIAYCHKKLQNYEQAFHFSDEVLDLYLEDIDRYGTNFSSVLLFISNAVDIVVEVLLNEQKYELALDRFEIKHIIISSLWEGAEDEEEYQEEIRRYENQKAEILSASGGTNEAALLKLGAALKDPANIPTSEESESFMELSDIFLVQGDKLSATEFMTQLTTANQFIQEQGEKFSLGLEGISYSVEEKITDSIFLDTSNKLNTRIPDSIKSFYSQYGSGKLKFKGSTITFLSPDSSKREKNKLTCWMTFYDYFIDEGHSEKIFLESGFTKSDLDTYRNFIIFGYGESDYEKINLYYYDARTNDVDLENTEMMVYDYHYYYDYDYDGDFNFPEKETCNDISFHRFLKIMWGKVAERMVSSEA